MNRTRVRNQLTPQTVTKTVKRWQTTDLVSYSTTPAGPTVGFSESMTDVVNVGFRRLVKSGVVFNNPMTRTKKTFTTTNPMYSWDYVGSYPQHLWTVGMAYSAFKTGHEWVGRYDSYPVPLDTDDLLAYASTQALANVRKPEMESLVFMAEFRQALQMLRNPIQGVTKYLTSNRKSVKKALKGAADQHLTVIYGMLPFIKDVNTALKVLQSATTRHRYTARGLAQESDKVTYTTPYAQPNVTSTIYGTATRVYSVRAGRLYHSECPTMDMRLGLSLSDVPSALWEITPFSFVADWFVNIGDTIRAYTPQVGVNTLADWITINDVTTTTEVMTPPTGVINDWNYQGGAARGVLVEEVTTRIPYNLSSWRAPVFKFDLNTSQILSSISLITQRLLK